MSTERIKQELLDGGLHEESTERMIEHYLDMRAYLGRGDYVEAGSHVGNFCENVANILLDQMGEDIRPSISLGTFVDECLSGKIGTDQPDEARLTIPRVLSAAYGLRNNRDSVHVNLQIEVNHADTQAAVRMCSWILTELLRIYGSKDDMDLIAELIEELSHPLTSYIDEHEGHRLIQHTGLEVGEEILLHLLNSTGETDVEKLVEWIPNSSSRAIKVSLSRFAESRKVLYDSDKDTAVLTTLGSKRAREIEQEYFDV